MRKLLTLFLLLVAVPSFAKDKKENKQDNFDIPVHVQSSRLVDVCNQNCLWVEHVMVTIDGKRYELSENTARKDLLRTGDYKARIQSDETIHSFEYLRIYEFQMPNGELRRFIVVQEFE